MSTLRTFNWLGQARVDSPHLRSVDAGVRGDFDLLAGKVLAGDEALVVKGFTLVTAGATGAPADQLQIITAGSILLHPLSTASGTIFSVPADRAAETLNSSSARVSGSFVANTTNYIGVDVVRAADDATSDVVQFLQPTLDTEVAEEVPLAKTTDYVIYISTSDFSSTPGLCPIAIVVTDANNNVSTMTDARPFAYGLGSGGTSPDPEASYGWPTGRGPQTSTDFTSADKAIGSQKAQSEALLTRVWEIGGGERWYSPTADRNVKMIRTGAPFVSTGDWFDWNASTDLFWTGLYFVFDNSTAYSNQVKDQSVSSEGLTDLADGECIYVDIDRTTNRSGLTALQPVKAELETLGTPTIPGSRFVIAWRIGSEIFARDSQWKVNAAMTPATTSAIGGVRLNITPGNASFPTVPAIDANGSIIVTETAGTGNAAIQGNGAATTTGVGGNGFLANGGAATGVGGTGGVGALINGGASSNGTGGPGGDGAIITGGNSTDDAGGIGLTVYGGEGNDGAGHAVIVYPGYDATGLTVYKAGYSSVGSNDGTVCIDIKTEASAADNNLGPVLRVRNSAGTRNIIDHLGVPTVQKCYFTEQWFYRDTTAMDASSPWSESQSGGGTGTRVLANPTSTTGYLGNWTSLTATYSGTNTYQNQYTERALFPFSTGGNNCLSFCSEFVVKSATAVDANTELWVGFTSDETSPAGAVHTMAFRYVGGTDLGGTWHTYCRNSGAANAPYDTTLAITTGAGGPSQVLRIEMYGSSADSSTVRVIFFIDGSWANTFTADLPTAPMKMFFRVGNLNTISAKVLEVGAVGAAWNVLPSNAMYYPT